MGVVAIIVGVAAVVAATADAAAPGVNESWVEGVSETTATLRAGLDGGGLATTYRFEYLSESVYQANLIAGREGFFDARRVPEPEGSIGKGGNNVVAQRATGLAAETSYRYRVVVSNAEGAAIGPPRVLTTLGVGGPLVLLDNRGWEMVSPVDKNGGEIQGPGGNSGGGVLQAAAQGEAMTFSSASSFAGSGQGAPVASQYLASRSSGGWLDENITAPLAAGAYGEEPDGVPYQLFSEDLSRGLLEAPGYPPLPGTGAPAGYANYYLREGTGSFTPLLTYSDIAGLRIPPSEFKLSFAGASPDLAHVVLSTCAVLTADATEVVDPDGCDEAQPNLYEWSSSGLRLVNLLPGEGAGTPGARLAAPSGAVSSDGSRVYWTDGSNLYLREGSRTIQVDAGLGGGGAFQLATPNGALAFFTKGEKLFRYEAATETTAELTPAGGVLGVLGASADGSYVYFATAAAIFLAHAGAITEVAPAPDPINYPPSTGVARVSAEGTRLAFVSTAELTPYDNTDVNTGEPDAEVYLYDADSHSLTCVSCDPTGERPTGSASMPGAVANGMGEGATRAYRPRALSEGGRRLFFDSPDPLVLQDTNREQDVYEWESGGTGNCAKSQGCLQLISSGRAGGGASFVDASSSGGDVFFLTDGSLVGADPGAFDVYDAREGGGFPEPPSPIPCEEDACQPLPPPPEDPDLGSLVPSTGNPPVHFPKHKKRKRKHPHRRVAKRHRPRHRRGHR